MIHEAETLKVISVIIVGQTDNMGGLPLRFCRIPDSGGIASKHYILQEYAKDTVCGGLFDAALKELVPTGNPVWVSVM